MAAVSEKRAEFPRPLGPFAVGKYYFQVPYSELKKCHGVGAAGGSSLGHFALGERA